MLTATSTFLLHTGVSTNKLLQVSKALRSCHFAETVSIIFGSSESYQKSAPSSHHKKIGSSSSLYFFILPHVSPCLTGSRACSFINSPSHSIYNTCIDGVSNLTFADTAVP